MLVRTLQNDTVDLVCWRHLGQTDGVVEATLQLNPGLAQRGPILPAGVQITLATPQPSVKPMVQLWT